MQSADIRWNHEESSRCPTGTISINQADYSVISLSMSSQEICLRGSVVLTKFCALSGMFKKKKLSNLLAFQFCNITTSCFSNVRRTKTAARLQMKLNFPFCHMASLLGGHHQSLAPPIKDLLTDLTILGIHRNGQKLILRVDFPSDRPPFINCRLDL